MEPWAKRLHDLLEAGKDRGLSMSGLVKATKAKQPSVLQWFKAAGGKPPIKMIKADLAYRAAQYVGTTVEYLLTGRGVAGASQPERFGQEKIEAAVKLLGFVSEARPDDRRFRRFTWPMVMVAAKAIEKHSGDQRKIIAAILAELSEGV